MEWGGFDLESELALVPRGQSFSSVQSGKMQGLTWQNQYGFIAINPARLPYAMDGMNDTGLTVGHRTCPASPGIRRWWRARK